jgi:iron complex transport system substrate-binding protein
MRLRFFKWLNKSGKHICAGLATLPLLPLLLLPLFAGASISVKDDAGRSITLEHPAQRIISLAPHATELLFAAGANRALIGVSDYSNFPEAAKKIPSVGSAFALDIERVIALKPDLIVVWGTGGAKILARQLREQHLTVFESEPRDFEAVASSIERFAKLADTSAVGDAAAAGFRARLQSLHSSYQLSAKQTPLKVFYQIWQQPLMTLNGEHLISQLLHLCGGENIFSALKEINPTVSLEAVLAANPDVIMSTGDDQQSKANLFEKWRPFQQLNAVRHANLFAVNDDWMSRPGPRILDATEAVCKYLQTARSRLNKTSK